MSETTRVMLDIETLGLNAGCAILSIGAVRFDTDTVGEGRHWNISLESCQDAGLTIDADTLEWWLDQDGDVQHVLTGGMPLTRALREFQDWFGSMDADEIWANSPAFDCVNLSAAYDAAGEDCPWEYYQERDVRTLKELPVAVDVEQEGNEHDALDDARTQARMVSKTLARLQEAVRDE